MFKNLNEKDKKKIYSLLSLGVVCTIALIVMPSFSKEESETEKKSNVDNQAQIAKENREYSLEEKLKNILSQIDGAGELDVMITFESSEEIQPAFNTNSTTEKTEEKDPKGGERTITTASENRTMITSSSSDPIVIKTNEAKIKGVIVVASGASDPHVKETLYSAVQTALQISGHQVEIYSK
ncbi:stage III sporulation protein AG [Romboutsia sp.]|uniref:stage III sporulation protein AG n=1 Tax=Romboutsia sp. TaxID=1965302 RepID=UPI002CBCBD29|nr:stage III sporulation protein AG [Romboutsia sp.]HSQ88454.1 stage III sporulation protein AG [Romboutsia sp.]